MTTVCAPSLYKSDDGIKRFYRFDPDFGSTHIALDSTDKIDEMKDAANVIIKSNEFKEAVSVLKLKQEYQQI